MNNLNVRDILYNILSDCTFVFRDGTIVVQLLLLFICICLCGKITCTVLILFARIFSKIFRNKLRTTNRKRFVWFFFHVLFFQTRLISAHTNLIVFRRRQGELLSIEMCKMRMTRVFFFRFTRPNQNLCLVTATINYRRRTRAVFFCFLFFFWKGPKLISLLVS